DDLKRVVAAGLKIGTLDLKQPWGDLASADAGKQRAVVQANAQYIAEAAKLGARNYFTVAFPEDPARPRKETFEYAVAGYGALCESIAAAGARIVFEGYPGNDGTLACTPADYRALLGELPASAGVN